MTGRAVATPIALVFPGNLAAVTGESPTVIGSFR
jgi:hypothetical protein